MIINSTFISHKFWSLHHQTLPFYLFWL